MHTHSHLLTLFAVLGLASSAFGVATVSSGSTTYLTTGAATETSAWDYVGTINGSSGVYLGDGWVVTCGHVLSLSGSTSTFALDGTTYTIAADTIQYVVDGVDLVMFRLSNYSNISLAALTLATNTTTANAGSNVLMIGYGHWTKAYGYATVYNYSYTSRTVTETIPTDYGTFTSVDMLALSTTSQVVGGDSGGGLFYKDSNGNWVLSGVIELTSMATVNGSNYYATYAVDIATYETAIEEVKASSVPEPSTLAMAGASLGLVWWSRRRKDRKA